METEQPAPEWPLDNETKAEKKMFFKINENEDAMYQNLWDTFEAMFREIYSTKCPYEKQGKI